jgi:hypothetical protein
MLAPAIASPPCFNFVLDVANDVAHLATEDRLVQKPRAQELLDEPLEPEAQRNDACYLADDLHLALAPWPRDSAYPRRAAPRFPEHGDPSGIRDQGRFSCLSTSTVSVETLERQNWTLVAHVLSKLGHIFSLLEKGRRPE